MSDSHNKPTDPTIPTSKRLETKNVFVDTSIHIGNKYIYKEGNFGRLVDLANADCVTIVETTVDVNEVRSNIEKTAEEAANALRKFQREASSLRAINEPAVSGLFINLQKEQISKLLGNEFESYRSRAKIQSVPFAYENAETVFQRYFENKPPFEGGNKKAEFPDAFIIAALEAWCRSEGKKVYVVSKDSGLLKAAEETGVLLPLESLEELFDLVMSELHSEPAIAARGWLLHHQPEIVERITEESYDLGFDIDEVNGDVEDVEIQEIDLGDPLLVAVEGQNIIFDIPCEITFIALLSYEDPNTGIYDSEEKRMLFMEQRRIRVRHTELIDAELTLSLMPKIEIQGIVLKSESVIALSLEDELIESLLTDEEDEFP